jgi:hypothetical protein
VISLSNVKFVQEHKEILDSFLLENSLVQAGKMYGHPAYYVGGKMFASLFQEGVCIKLPESRVKELVKKQYIDSFEPRGRKMREWILITRKNSKDYLKDKDIFLESIDFVFSISQNEKRVE